MSMKDNGLSPLYRNVLIKFRNGGTDRWWQTTPTAPKEATTEFWPQSSSSPPSSFSTATEPPSPSNARDFTASKPTSPISEFRSSSTIGSHPENNSSKHSNSKYLLDAGDHHSQSQQTQQPNGEGNQRQSNFRFCILLFCCVKPPSVYVLGQLVPLSASFSCVLPCACIKFKIAEI